MKKSILTVFCAFAFYTVSAQEVQDTSEIETMEEVLISAQRLGLKRAMTSRQIEVITSRQMELAAQPTMAEVLSQGGQVFVQKSQLGGGSPVLRGFEASRVLLVVDGVRMNNAVYRAGHLQDIITVDQFMLDRTEVLFGSGSTQYGSDALGGVIYMKTRDAVFRNARFGLQNLNANVRYMSAGNAWVRNMNASFGGRKMAMILSATYSEFGDLRSGQRRNFSKWDTFGQRNWYATRINVRDTIQRNNDPFVQLGTAYNQADLFGKFAVKTGKLTHVLNAQYSHSGNVPRYDRLTDVNNGKFRFAVWDYRPQIRSFFSYSLMLPENEKFRQRMIISNQMTKVGRAVRRFGQAEELIQTDQVSMTALNYDAGFLINPKLEIQGGGELVYNSVSSEAQTRNINTGETKISRNTRYADGGAATFAAAIFANGIYKVRKEDFVIEGGFRLTYYQLEANYTENNFLNLPYSAARLSNFAPVYNIGLNKKMDMEGLFFKASLASGFRNPNVDDMTKLFESVPGAKLVVPNDNLRAERSRTLDIGISRDHKKYRFELGGYYTKVSRLLIDGQSQINGEDSIDFDGIRTPVFQMLNTAGGYITGFYFAGKAKISGNLYADFNYTSTFGRYRAMENGVWQPIDHVAPDHGRVGLRWATRSWQCEAFMLFNGRKVAREYSPSGEDNPQYAPGRQTPSWQTYNFRASWQVDRRLTGVLAVENIFDLHYRTFSSGTSAPGRNLILSLKVSL